MIRARVPKQIKLEILYKQGVFILLALNYIAFFFALAFDFFEYDLRIKVDTQQVTIPLPDPTLLTSRRTQLADVGDIPGIEFYAEIANLTFLNRFLWVHLDAHGPVNLTGGRLTISFNAQAVGRNDDNGTWDADTSSVASHNLTCTQYGCSAADIYWTTALRYSEYRIIFKDFRTFVRPDGASSSSSASEEAEAGAVAARGGASAAGAGSAIDGGAATSRQVPANQRRDVEAPSTAAAENGVLQSTSRRGPLWKLLWLASRTETDDAKHIETPDGDEAAGGRELDGDDAGDAAPGDDPTPPAQNGTAALEPAIFLVQFTYHSSDVSWYEMCLNLGGLLFSAMFLAYWIIQIVVLQRWWESLPEQRWITFLLVAVMLYQNPMFVPSLYLFSNQAAVLASKSFIVIATTFFLVFLLLVVDGLSYTYSNYTWRFYARKVAFGAVWLASCWTLVFFIFQVTPSTVELGVHYYIALLVAGVIAVICGACWPIWYLVTLYRTGRKLSKLPFLSTRYRQLAFRFILLQSTLAVVYLIGKLVFMTFSTVAVETSMYEFLIQTSYASISTFVLISVCMYSISFAYLPPWSSLRFLCTKLNGKDKWWAAQSEFDYCILEKDAPPSGLTFCLETASWLLEFSWDAYFDPDGISTPSSFGPLQLEKADLMGFRFHHYLYDHKDDIFVAFFAKGPGTLVVAFRGTSSMRNVATDIRIRTVPIPHWTQGLHLPEIGFLEPRAHSGFYNAYTKIWRDLINVITKFVARSGGVPVKVYCTGHSLGGALATIAAFEINTCLDVEVHMYNFGSPRVGNHSFANLYNRQVPRSFRVVNDCDMVTSLPDSRMMWDFKHIGKEIIIDHYGNLITDLTYVERRFRAFRSSLNDHRLDNYRRAVMECFRQSGGDHIGMVRTLSNLARNTPLDAVDEAITESAAVIALGADPDDANADSPRVPLRSHQAATESTPLLSPV